ncbi:MAG: hypothetical protein JXA23_10475 [Bacteroidales bacterium]|nr:hypothetical protein [Bacteroidales bacterium]
MKTPPLIFLIALISTLASAQSDTISNKHRKERNVLLDFAAAYSMPFGHYASPDTTEDLSGYAEGGFSLQFSGTWLGKRHLGLSATYCYQRNALQKAVEFVKPDGHDYFLGTKPWSNHYLLAGPAYANTFGRFFFLSKIQAGVVLSFSPNFTMSMPENQADSTSPPSTYQSGGAGTGVAFQVMVAGGYQITKKLAITLNLTYLGANASRKKDYYVSSYYYDPELKQWILVWQGGEFTIKKKISTFNVGIGISFRL